jgi:hypothetical protein
MALPTVRQMGEENLEVERMDPAETAVMRMRMNKKAQTQEMRNLGRLRCWSCWGQRLPDLQPGICFHI